MFDRAVAGPDAPPASLGRDPRFPFLGMALSPGQMREFFNRVALPFLCPGREAGPVRIRTMVYRPGSKCAFVYAFHFTDTLAGPEQWAVVTFDKGKGLESAFYDDPHGPDASDGWPRGGAVYLREYWCRVELFPRDGYLPSLPMAADPSQMAALFDRLAIGSGRPAIDVLSYRPHRRCVLKYVRASPAETTEVVGRVYRPGPRAARIGYKMARLRLHGAAHGLTVPRLLCVEDAWNLLLQEWVPGVPLPQVLAAAKTRSEAAGPVRLAAAGLAALHSFPLDVPEMDVQSLEGELARMRGRARKLQEVAPRLAEQASALLAGLAPLAQGHIGIEPTFVHDDCKPAHYLTQEDGRVAVIDLDRACLGDPAVDVGKFMAGLNEIAVRTGADHLRTLDEVFLEEYQARASDDGVALRARLAQVITLVRNAMSRFRSAPYSDFGEPSLLPSLLLQEAAACFPRR
ncbi:MAG: aminoglycoside phosphotransferase family protein [Chloroflexi bacterium]|nr:aminoglycoside phosphotransferase family protein [Chloroflexota bacterium]